MTRERSLLTVWKIKRAHAHFRRECHLWQCREQSFNHGNDLTLGSKNSVKSLENDSPSVSDLCTGFNSATNCVTLGKLLSFASIVIFIETIF